MPEKEGGRREAEHLSFSAAEKIFQFGQLTAAGRIGAVSGDCCQADGGIEGDRNDIRVAEYFKIFSGQKADALSDGYRA